MKTAEFSVYLNMENEELSFRLSNKSLYAKMHRDVRKKFDIKHTCSFCGTSDKKRYELALKKGRQYSFSVDDYVELCVPCHRQYDVTDDFKTKCKKRALNNLPDPKGERLPSQAGKMGGEHQTAKQIIQLNMLGDVVKVWDSISDASRALNISVPAICNCTKGLSKSSGGFIWKFKN